MARLKISTPADPAIYPLRILEAPHPAETRIDKGDILAVLELVDGARIRMASPVAGVLVESPEPGRIFTERGRIGLIEQTEHASSPASAGPSPAAAWKASLTLEQINLTETTFRQAFGSACDGDPQLHPADRAVQAGVPFSQILELEKAAYSRSLGTEGSAAGLAVATAGYHRETARRDGYEIKLFVDNKSTKQLPFFIPAFLAPLIDSMIACEPVKYWKLYALEEAAKRRPQSFESAWDYVLPDIGELRAVCSSHPPDFDALANTAAAAFGKSELERVLRSGFSDDGHPSAPLWSAYASQIEEASPARVPDSRAVGLHPVDIIWHSETPPSTRQRDVALERARRNLAGHTTSPDDLPVQYLQAAYDKHLDCSGLSAGTTLWSRFRIPIVVALPLALAAGVIVAPDTFDDFFDTVGSGFNEIGEGMSSQLGGRGSGVADRSKGGSSTRAVAGETSAASRARWTGQTPMTFYRPPSLASVDNGKTPRPSAATRAAFQTWLEE